MSYDFTDIFQAFWGKHEWYRSMKGQPERSQLALEYLVSHFQVVSVKHANLTHTPPGLMTQIFSLHANMSLNYTASLCSNTEAFFLFYATKLKKIPTLMK